MIVVSNTTAQTLTPGQSITFDSVVFRTRNGAECHRDNSNFVRMRARGVYAVAFSGNIGATAQGIAQIAIQLGGSTLPETTMISTTAAAGDLNNVATETRVPTCCGAGMNLTVTNTGTTDITIGANTAFVVNRVA